MRSAVDAVQTVHHGHMPEIELTSPTTATRDLGDGGQAAVAGGCPIRTLHGYGHYHETYEKLDGQWRIKTIRLTRLRVDAEMA